MNIFYLCYVIVFFFLLNEYYSVLLWPKKCTCWGNLCKIESLSGKRQNHKLYSTGHDTTPLINLSVNEPRLSLSSIKAETYRFRNEISARQKKKRGWSCEPGACALSNRKRISGVMTERNNKNVLMQGDIFSLTPPSRSIKLIRFFVNTSPPWVVLQIRREHKYLTF